MNARFHQFLTIFFGSVWGFHGLFSKLSNGIPRHRLIVGRILGEGIADWATRVIAILEISLGLWIFSGLWRRSCALVYTSLPATARFPIRHQMLGPASFRHWQVQ